MLGGCWGVTALLGFGVSKGWGGWAQLKGNDWDVTQSWQVTGWLLVPGLAVYPSSGSAALGDRSVPQDGILGQL